MSELRDEHTTLTPPLKWAGGKRWLIPVLASLFDNRRRLVEPFCGGLAVALGLSPKRALLSDANPHAINFYRKLQGGLVIRQPLRNERVAYYEARERFNQMIRRGRFETKEAAGLFYYLNRTGFNGLCRFNSQGFFNVPFGRYGQIPYRRDFSEYAPLLKRWVLQVGDFESVDLRGDDFLYADPPYDVPFRRYAGSDFTWNDQVRLAEWLAAHRGPVVASNQATERVLKLYRKLGFEIRLLSAPRRISCTGDRTPAKEMLALRIRQAAPRRGVKVRHGE